MPKKIGTDLILPEVGPSSSGNFEATPILHQLHGVSQVFRLKKLITQRNLTESLDLLEKSGFSGDFALFVIQNIQLMEVF
jgi:hypothetical protein